MYENNSLGLIESVRESNWKWQYPSLLLNLWFEGLNEGCCIFQYPSLFSVFLMDSALQITVKNHYKAMFNSFLYLQQI